jgi:hypothetical protein
LVKTTLNLARVGSPRGGRRVCAIGGKPEEISPAEGFALALLAPLIRDKQQYWKWMIIGAHSALQGAMVCALRIPRTRRS